MTWGSGPTNEARSTVASSRERTRPSAHRSERRLASRRAFVRALVPVRCEHVLCGMVAPAVSRIAAERRSSSMRRGSTTRMITRDARGAWATSTRRRRSSLAYWQTAISTPPQRTSLHVSAQRPSMHTPEQHGMPPAQSAPRRPHAAVAATHVPGEAVHAPLQQSADDMQLAPSAVHGAVQTFVPPAFAVQTS